MTMEMEVGIRINTWWYVTVTLQYMEDEPPTMARAEKAALHVRICEDSHHVQLYVSCMYVCIRVYPFVLCVLRVLSCRRSRKVIVGHRCTAVSIHRLPSPAGDSEVDGGDAINQGDMEV